MPLRPFGRDRQSGRRATFRPPPDFAVLTSLWVNLVAAGDVTTLTLQHDYPDFTPVAGWKADVANQTYVLTAVSGRELTCAEEGGEP